ncbi:hypothetical protein BCR34DRAFT_481605 [Clohesyomyces aquaticus]|uniref:Uncharacterized protein n=1 Tax=Clohesyomyces aquaticus TaxID=1231657 RepID=A0A1Y1ZS07_9PLEO|nr:hypothetical protein BCR34DRAFT_481605 [Clohesyomyces aquaticus]
MSQGPLAQSSERSALFARLGMTAQHEDIHRMMLVTQVGRDRLSEDPANLIPHLRTDPSIGSPYKWDEISETAKHREILNIVNFADYRTRPYYEMGRYVTGVNEENWVVRWYLWHSFRYRDNRDHGRKPIPAQVCTSKWGVR